MAQKYILVTVFRKNTHTLATPQNQWIDCDNSHIKSVVYMIPNINNGIVEDYMQRTIENPDDVPAGAIRTVRIEDPSTGNTVWVLVADDQDVTTLVEGCNQCCDGETDFTYNLANLPRPVLEWDLCYAGVTSVTVEASAPLNPFTSNVTLDNPTHDGGQPFAGLNLAAGGYASTAALATALNTQIPSAGTWSSPSAGKIRLVTTTLQSINLNVVLVPKIYCLPLPSSAFTAATLTVTKDDLTTIAVNIAGVAVSQAGATALANELRKHLTGGTITVTTSGGNPSLQYSGLQKPVKVSNAAGSSNATFTAGACV